MSFLMNLLGDERVEKNYVVSGGKFGGAVSSIAMGECVGFEGMLKGWNKWEK